MSRNIVPIWTEQEDKHYLKKVDEASASVTYVGWAATGTATSAAEWRLQKISVVGTVTTIALA